jgi:toxin HigB-1
MIVEFWHKGLQQFVENGSARGVNPQHARRLRLILGLLAIATGPQSLNLPALRLHALRGDRAGEWALTVSGNWRVTFSFDGQNATNVDYEDYH